MSGIVYFLHDAASQAIKIGWTKRDVATRRAAVQVGNPNRVDVIGTLAGSPKTERAWHEEFAELSIRGEWFRAAKELIDAIHERAERPAEPSGHAISVWLIHNETTQEAFASAVGISRMQLWRIMNGSIPSRQTALSIQDATKGKVKAAVLLKLEDAA